MSKNGHPRESEDAVEESDRSEAGADGGSDGGDSDGGDGGDGGDDADGERRRSATTGPHRAMPGIGAKRIVTGMRRSSGCSSVVRRWLRCEYEDERTKVRRETRSPKKKM